MTDPVPEFSRRLAVAAVTAHGRVERLSACEEERAALAARFGLIAIDRLEGEITLTPYKRGGVRLRGVGEAAVTQACVVTLDPVPQTLVLAFERRFEPGAPDPNLFDGDIEALLAEDPPDPVPEDGAIDLGEVLAEELALSLDPYPRSPGAEVPEAWRGETDDGDGPSRAPFVVLKGGRDT